MQRYLVILGAVFIWCNKVAAFFISTTNGPKRPALAPKLYPSRSSVFARQRTKFPTLFSSQEGETKAVESKEDRLLSLLNYLDKLHSSQELFPCGLEAEDKERALVQSVVTEVEEDDENNLVSLNKGKIDAKDLFGDWKLLYTSSQTLIINKSLSGLGRSSSDMAKFSGIVQKLGGNKFFGNVELVEHFQGATEDASFDVKVTGEWFTLPDTNPFTKNPITAIEIQPSKIDYVATTTNAKDWASLGPIKRLDIIYLSQTMMISRGSANPDSLFVWKRV